MFVATLLVGLSQKIKVPYPICLVLGGAIMGFIPLEYVIYFDPDLILLIVLPPILYYAAFEISFREFRSNLKEIVSLALGLVAFNTFVVGLIFHLIFPFFPWALAFAFGAIVSPPDAVAATSILKRFNINTKLLTILEGESLVNDASALVLYKMAVIALLSGIFSPWQALATFIFTVLGGIIIGVLLGYVLQTISRLFFQPVLSVVFSFTLPYVVYVMANYLQVSGVLAVVATGLVSSKILAKYHSTPRRIFGYVSWDIFITLMNCFVFILIGLQLQTLTSTMTFAQMVVYIANASLITAALILVRMGWVYTRCFFLYLNFSKPAKNLFGDKQPFREATLIGWAGMRGIVSLTAALALPYTMPNGMPLEGRSQVVFVIFIIILLSLLIPGLTLAPLVKSLNLSQSSNFETVFAVKQELIKIGKNILYQLHSSKKVSAKENAFLIAHFELNHQLLNSMKAKEIYGDKLDLIKSSIIKEQRKKLIELWETMQIDDKLLSELEQELDLEEINMTRAELS